MTQTQSSPLFHRPQAFSCARRLLLLSATICLLLPAWAQPDSLADVLPASVARFDKVFTPTAGIVRVKSGTKLGFVRIADDTLIAPPVYERALDFAFGRAVVAQEELYGFLDTTGTVAIPLQYERAWSFHDSLAMVQQDGLFGFINVAGEVVIPIRYQRAQSVQDGMAMVSINGKSGFYNSQGYPAVPLMYDEAWPFFGDKAYVRLGANWFYINKRGDCIEGCE